MSTSMFFGISAGRHSISISRSNCSRIPPSVFTPNASPLSTTGTVTVSRLSMAMRCRSTWSRFPLIGSNCQSTIIAFTRSLSIARSKIVLCPLSDFRMRSTCRGSTATESAPLPAPYKTAGIFPPTRTRRAAFLVPGSRFCASRMLISVAVAIIPFPSFSTRVVAGLCPATRKIPSQNSPIENLNKKSADRSLFVNRLNRPPNQPRDRKHLDLRDLLCRLSQRNGVSHHHLRDRRVHQILHRRPRKHRMRAARIHRTRPIFNQSLRHLHQRSRRVNQVVNDQTSAPADVADHVHHFRHVHLDAPFIHDGQCRIHLLREEPRPFHAARIRRNHRKIRQVQFPEVIHQHRRSKQMV